MNKFLGIITLVLLLPLWIILYALALIGQGAIWLFNFLYHPIYDFAGKPLDT